MKERRVRQLWRNTFSSFGLKSQFCSCWLFKLRSELSCYILFILYFTPPPLNVWFSLWQFLSCYTFLYVCLHVAVQGVWLHHGADRCSLALWIHMQLHHTSPLSSRKSLPTRQRTHSWFRVSVSVCVSWCLVTSLSLEFLPPLSHILSVNEWVAQGHVS